MTCKKASKKIRICTQIETDLVAKVEIISSCSGISRSNIYNKGLSMAIGLYEQKCVKIDLNSSRVIFIDCFRLTLPYGFQLPNTTDYIVKKVKQIPNNPQVNCQY